jgi:hypothetical protein
MTGLRINPTGGTENTACEVAEIFVYNSVLSSTQLLTIEGYLAQKWGLQSRLAIYNNPVITTPSLPIATSAIRIWNSAATLAQANGVALTTWPSTGTSGPTVNCTGVVFTNQLNGNRVVRFTTGQTWSTSPVINYSSYTLIFVARLTGTTNRRMFQTNTGNSLYGYWSGSKRAVYEGAANGPTQLTTVPADTSWDIISYTRVSSGAFIFRWNGNLLFSGTTSPATTLTGLVINAGTNGAESSTCEVAEVIVTDSVLTQAQVIQIEEYLSFVWGIPISRRHTYSLFRS